MNTPLLKPHFSAAAKLLAAAALMLLALATARAQAAPPADARLRLESLDRVAPKAAKALRVDVDGMMLSLGKSMLSDDDPDEKTLKEIIEGLRGVYVRIYTFESEGGYGEADLSDVRAQLRGPAWTRLVDVQTRGAKLDGAEVYAVNVAGRVEGMAVLLLQPKRLIVVNVLGSVDLDKLRRLEGTLGIPRIHIGRDDKDGRKKN